MRTISIIISVLAVGLVSVARADEPTTTFSAAGTIIYPMSFAGKGVTPTILHSVTAFIPVGGRWRVAPRVGMATPVAAFQPAPHLQAGLVAKLADRYSLGVSAMYRYLPHWSGTANDAHLVGASIVPAVALSSKIMLVFAAGASRNLTTKQNSLCFGFELGFPLSI